MVVIPPYQNPAVNWAFVICELPTGVAMARAMVDMGLVQVPRAYPSAGLKAIPERW